MYAKRCTFRTIWRNALLLGNHTVCIPKQHCQRTYCLFYDLFACDGDLQIGLSVGRIGGCDGFGQLCSSSGLGEGGPQGGKEFQTFGENAGDLGI